MKTTAELTIEYIKSHPNIKSCLKQGLINYSSLARQISKELKIEKKTSIEAILVAARRFQDKLSKEKVYEKKIKELLHNSEIEIKNKIVVFIVKKSINQELFQKIQSEAGLFSVLEGSTSYTVITQEKNASQLEKKLKGFIIKSTKDLALINIKSGKDIENIPGIIAYLTSLFAENGVNILEFLSSWTDTLFVIDKKDVNKVLEFLEF
ncbi:ACT domain-containing protein [Candidatus Woesearchaeota archaeon]|jgi:aspartokinase|nr:ACT domain-containing protein [Candidatus Woesearchaeota archaeon]MBT4110987.1 ACT domain-containing protein [Candidatus Woesearchaeota archaeon]MBT4336856.1 ACT domain-containing protein [Candidatus Woesearchaeota archaeon]MBT4469829.1 ACT domain-containing protein [Candidatus Woesearchaeota archaeon]MBT6743700.1 ACT domain-containing protein [Candidatus Woesearchaeota archaeon]